MQDSLPPVSIMLSDAEIEALPLPPVAKGFPLSHVRGFMQDALAMVQRLRRENGPAVRLPLFRRSVLFIFGADATERVLLSREGDFSSERGWEPIIHRIFPHALMAMDGAEHKYHRGIMQSAFSRGPLASYLEEMNPVIDGSLDTWMADGARQVDMLFYPRVKQLTLDVAASAFMGIELDEEAARLNQYFMDAVYASLAYIRWPVPPFKMWRGVRGRRELIKRFRELIPEKRAQIRPDLFSRLCHARSEDGDTYTDQEIADHMNFVMMAAHDTSTSTLTTMAYLLAKHPQWQERLRAASFRYRDEQGSPFIAYGSMEQLEELNWVAKEALRLYPPLSTMPRVATRDLELCGYRIPKGQLIALSPIYNHHDPAFWTSPASFDPERFSPGRAEDKRHRCAWTPFGGGMHKCIGQYFGLMEIRATMHLLLQKYRLSIPDGYEMPYQLVPIARPKDGLPLRIERLD